MYKRKKINGNITHKGQKLTNNAVIYILCSLQRNKPNIILLGEILLFTSYKCKNFSLKFEKSTNNSMKKKMEPMTTLHEKAWNKLICYYQPRFFGHPFINCHVQFLKNNSVICRVIPLFILKKHSH